jgi:hypothetical protein
MAAGLGFKTFTTGEVLTAGDVNGYLMQGINVFTNATARDAAITAPAEGQFAFTKDNNSLWYYDGTAWVASGATGDIEGVTAGVGISGGGTSGTVTVTNSMATAIDAKGDLVPGTGADTFARLAVGANGTVLTADSAEATGLKWASGGSTPNYQLINTGGTALTGASTITVSGISGKNNLMIEIVGASAVNAQAYINIRFNSDSTNAYDYAFTGVTSGSSPFADSLITDSIYLGRCGLSATDVLSGYMHVFGANAAGVKPFNSIGAGKAGTTREAWNSNGRYDGTSAITSVSVLSDQGNFDAGTIYVYGA